jgi:hypothetical protein
LLPFRLPHYSPGGRKREFFFLTLVGLYNFAMGLSLEIACFNEESAVNAADGGADRIE